MTRDEARAAGRTTFTTNRLCKHGHISERWTCSGSCCACARLNNSRRRKRYATKVAAYLREWRARRKALQALPRKLVER